MGFISLYENIIDPSVELSKATVWGDYPNASTTAEPDGLNYKATTLSQAELNCLAHQ